jgi:hypothetical protein
MHDLFADLARFPANVDGTILLVVGGGVCVGFVFLVSIAALYLMRGGKKAPEPVSDLLEDLAAYPAPPPKTQQRLRVQGRPSRIRLVVIAPVGKRDLRELGEPEDLLNRVVHGLGNVARADRPRIRTWPPQLSNHGFAPSFLRNTRPPDGTDGPHWTLLAGPAKAGAVPILLGLAVWSEETTDMPMKSVEAAQWEVLLRVDE